MSVNITWPSLDDHVTIFLYNSLIYSGLSLKIYTEGVTFNLVLHCRLRTATILFNVKLSYKTWTGKTPFDTKWQKALMKNYIVSRYNENIWMTSKILQDIVKFADIVNAYNSFASTYFSREREGRETTGQLPISS